MAKYKYYVVWEGRARGIFNSWEECKEQVENFKGAKYKSFDDLESATEAVRKAPDDYFGIQRKIGEHSREHDIVVNPIRGKQLTNIRASGTDEAIRLVPPVRLTLESAVEFINDDELVEITPKSIRLRKRWLKEFERRRAARVERDENTL